MKRARRIVKRRGSPAAAMVRRYNAAVSGLLFTQDRGGSFVISNDVAAKAIDKGLRATIVKQILDAMSVEKGPVLEVIGIDQATLRKRTLLEEAEAAGAIRYMELTTLATETFGTPERASEWLEKPHPLLGGKTPLEKATNEYGVGKVKSMLLAIRYGGVV